MIKEVAEGILSGLDKLSRFNEDRHSYGDWHRERVELVMECLRAFKDATQPDDSADPICTCRQPGQIRSLSCPVHRGA